jgi:uncharacterized membrane protein
LSIDVPTVELEDDQLKGPERHGDGPVDPLSGDLRTVGVTEAALGPRRFTSTMDHRSPECDLGNLTAMATDPPSTKGPDSLPSVERLLTLSDGVVAIALTLLVLQLHVPVLAHDADQNSASVLWHQLNQGSDQFVSYLIAFYVIGQFWLAHHRVFRDVKGHREGLAWWNFAFLLTITLMPFTSNLLGEYPANPLAVDIFAINLLLASLTTQATYYFARQRGLLVVDDEGDRKAALARTGVLVGAIALSIGVAWFNTSLAKYCWLLIAAAPFLASRFFAETVDDDESEVADTQQA